ncbi:hypothetical protein ScPMuIL_000497 [Solemya velum]
MMLTGIQFQSGNIFCMSLTVTIINLMLTLALECPNCMNSSCDQVTGACDTGCVAGWSGTFCNMPKYICGPEWSLYDGTCFRFFNISKSWHEARSYCQALGNKSDLGIIYNSEMNEYMHCEY